MKTLFDEEEVIDSSATVASESLWRARSYTATWAEIRDRFGWTEPQLAQARGLMSRPQWDFPWRRNA